MTETRTPEHETLLQRVIDREGGYVDNPADPGGATKYGITALTLGNWRKLGRIATRDEVRALTREEAADIYWAWYLQPVAALPFQILEPVFDMGVNAGVAAAIKILQRTLHITADGVLGPQTIAKAASSDLVTLRKHFTRDRILYYIGVVTKRPTSIQFLRGWTNRAFEVL